jgi:glycosyltransferase involved in cell wall biosynthesis
MSKKLGIFQLRKLLLQTLKDLAKEALYMLLGLLGRLKSSENNTHRGHLYIIGDLYSESGLGNVTRALIASLGDSVDYKLINLPLSISSLQGTYNFTGKEVKKLGPGLSIYVGNPSILVQALLKLNLRYLVSNRTIGVWFWELEKIPNHWVKACRLVDEVWAQSDFAARAFNKSNQITKVMPFALNDKHYHFFDRNYFSIPTDRFIFLMTFDYLSHLSRKNPNATLKAFLEEFRGDQSVMLVVKSVNSNKYTGDDQLVMQARNVENIRFIDDYLTRDEMSSLISSADCYVSLHRSEGLGLGMAEAMSLGTLVIGTRYSGNMQYMHSGNSLLVDYTPIQVEAGEYPYAEGNVWADPSQHSARAQMRYAVQYKSECKILVSNAIADLDHYDTAHQLVWLKRNLK